MIWGSGGSKSRLAKTAGAEPAGQMRDEKLHAVVARSTFASEKAKSTSRSEHFLKLRCRKSARRSGAKHICKSKCKNTPGADHFWQLRCRKSARRCGAKHICKSKCAKHTRCGPLLAVEMSKKCTPLSRKAHVEVNMYKTPGVRTTFQVSDVASLHYTTLHHTSLHYINCTTLHSTTLQLQLHNYTPLHFTTLNFHYTRLHYTTLHYTTLHYTSLRCTTLHYTTAQYTTLHWMTLHHCTTDRQTRR